MRYINVMVGGFSTIDLQRMKCLSLVQGAVHVSGELESVIQTVFDLHLLTFNLVFDVGISTFAAFIKAYTKPLIVNNPVMFC